MRATPILFLDHAAGLGGAEIVLLDLLTHLDPARWEVYLGGTPGPLLDAAHARGLAARPLELHRLRGGAAPLGWLAGARAIAGLAQFIGARAIYANTVRAALYGARAARLARLPFIWHMHDFWLSENVPKLRALDTFGKWLLCRAARRVIVPSQAVRAAMGAGRKVRMVHNGIDAARYAGADAAAFRAAHGLGDAPVAGMAGRLRPWKGQARFLRAILRVAEGRPEARFLIIGGDPFGAADGYAASLPPLAESLGLSGRVTFTGQLDDIRPALAALDVFVHPGDPEPFGLVTVEAMALGKPVVAFAHGALPEIVLDGETGMLVPPRDEAALGDAVLSLLADPARRESFGAAGRSRVHEKFTMERMAREIEAVIGEAIR
jgi:glycosyltransferase involved in cell wall biosynthesis